MRSRQCSIAEPSFADRSSAWASWHYDRSFAVVRGDAPREIAAYRARGDLAASVLLLDPDVAAARDLGDPLHDLFGRLVAVAHADGVDRDPAEPV